PPISVEEYLAYENQAYQLMRASGLPPGFYDDPDDFAQLIGGNVSFNELQERVAAYVDVATVGREQNRDELYRFVGLRPEWGDRLDDGELASLLMDPQRALPALRQQVQAA